MTARGVLVAHREPMVAEALSGALGRFQHVVPVGVTSSADTKDLPEGRIDAAAVDAQMDDFRSLAWILRRRGTRVVFLGDGDGEDEGVWVSSGAPVAALAAVLVPGVPLHLSGNCLPITSREEEVLTLAARGFPAKQIASRLGISSKTVEAHKTRAFRKLGVPNQAAAVSLLTTSASIRQRPAAAIGAA